MFCFSSSFALEVCLRRVRSDYNRMIKTKLKSLFKIACYATVFVIFCYIEGKYELITGKSSMSGVKILSSEFEVFGRVQGELQEWLEMTTLTEIQTKKYFSFRGFLPKG